MKKLFIASISIIYIGWWKTKQVEGIFDSKEELAQYKEEQTKELRKIKEIERFGFIFSEREKRDWNWIENFSFLDI